jgi:hypothetical protein
MSGTGHVSALSGIAPIDAIELNDEDDNAGDATDHSDIMRNDEDDNAGDSVDNFDIMMNDSNEHDLLPVMFLPSQALPQLMRLS